jgi:hypothetical protein
MRAAVARHSTMSAPPETTWLSERNVSNQNASSFSKIAGILRRLRALRH